MFKPVQLAAVEALGNKLQWHKKLNKIYQKRKEKIHEFCSIFGCSYEKNAVGLFIWAEIPEGYVDGEAFADYLLDEFGNFVAPGFIFGENGWRYIRISLCQTTETLQNMIDNIYNSGKL